MLPPAVVHQPTQVTFLSFKIATDVQWHTSSLCFISTAIFWVITKHSIKSFGKTKRLPASPYVLMRSSEVVMWIWAAREAMDSSWLEVSAQSCHEMAEDSVGRKAVIGMKSLSLKKGNNLSATTAKLSQCRHAWSRAGNGRCRSTSDKLIETRTLEMFHKLVHPPRMNLLQRRENQSCCRYSREQTH